VLGISKGAFAAYIEMGASNLNKYYRSDRRFNTELALKFAYFFHTPANLWLKIQIKNELLQL
jgi:plasmid maintenance system antidote protein VapI